MAATGVPGVGNALALPPPNSGRSAIPVFKPKGEGENNELIKTVKSTALTQKTLIASFFKALVQWDRQNRARGRGAGFGTGQAGVAAKNAGPFGKQKEKPDPMDAVIKKGFVKLFKSKWFEGALEGIKKFSQRAGNLLLDLLKFFLFMAFFDPKGTLLRSLINIFAKIFTFIIVMLARLLPIAIGLMWDAIGMVGDAIANAMPEIVRAFTKVIDSLLPNSAFGTVLKTAIQGLGALLGFLAEHLQAVAIVLAAVMVAERAYAAFKWIQLAFDKNKDLWEKKSFAQKVAFYLWEAAAWTARKIQMGVQIAMTWATTAAGWLLNTSLGAMAVGIWAAIAPILPFVLAIAALIAVFYLIWKYADQIVGFFEGLYTNFTKLSPWLKNLVIGFAILLGPITLTIAAIYALAKAFQFFKGPKFAALKNIGKELFGSLSESWKKHGGTAKKLLGDAMGDIFGALGKGDFKGAIGAVKKHFMIILDFFGKVFGPSIKKAWGKIVKLFNLQPWIDQISRMWTNITNIKIPGIGDLLKKALSGVFGENAFERLKTLWEKTMDSVYATLLALWNRVKSGFGFTQSEERNAVQFSGSVTQLLEKSGKAGNISEISKLAAEVAAGKTESRAKLESSVGDKAIADALVKVAQSKGADMSGVEEILKRIYDKTGPSIVKETTSKTAK